MIEIASPQRENGYTGIANEIVENLFTTQLNGTQFRIIMVVFRYTYGFQRKGHEISETFLTKATGIDKRQIRRELKDLIDRQIITVLRQADFSHSRIITFNKNYEHWVDKPEYNQGTKETPEGELDLSPEGELDPQERKTKENSKETIDVFFETIWKLYPKRKGKGQVSKTQKEKLYKIGIEEMTRAINRYIQDENMTATKYLQYGSTFFNSGYVDYLDINYQEDKSEYTPSRLGVPQGNMEPIIERY